jgi:hypothetical protein
MPGGRWLMVRNSLAQKSIDLQVILAGNRGVVYITHPHQGLWMRRCTVQLFVPAIQLLE